jgi:hypothetical protein
MAAATLTSSDAAAAMDDRRLLELLMMLMAIHSLLPQEGAADDDAGELEQMKEIMMEFSMTIINKRDQSAVSKELLAVTQRLLDDVQLRSLDGGETEGRVEVSSSASDHHQLMDTSAAAAKKKKKKRNKRNKAAAKHKGTKRTWLGGGIISLLMMAVAFGSITKLTLIPQSDGSEGKAPPTLPPSASTSLRQRVLQSSNNMAPSSPASVSPFAAVVQAPIFSPTTASNSPMKSVGTALLSSTSSMCTNDTEGWYDWGGYDCSWYKVMDVPGCPQWGNFQTAHNSSTAEGTANDNCCYCKNDVVSTVVSAS